MAPGDNQQRPVQPVEDPILCRPYVEPDHYWLYDDNGVPQLMSGRRPAGYWFKSVRSGKLQMEIFREEQRDDLPLINALRDDVKRWRESGYRGVSKVTGSLLRHWARPDAPRRLFFCQTEAVETLIYLMELRIPGRSSRTGFQKFALSDRDLTSLLSGKPTQDLGPSGISPCLVDPPEDPSLLPLLRLGCKMATGSGKTVVMGMLISWAFCNRRFNPETRDYPNAVLVCCPNLTVKERLQVLRPEAPGNYYDQFELVPPAYRDGLNGGRVLVTNWHIFAPKSENREGASSYRVVQKGEESPEAFARDRLGELYDRLPILVMNDEGHHCWRPAPQEVDEDLTGEDRKRFAEEEEEARVWLAGLDRINNCGALGKGRPAFKACIDLSATPFYLKGSGHPEGRPFPWLVSDFGLVDAIESGIVKIPRLPIVDDAKRVDEVGRPDPKYFRLWRRINDAIGKGERLANQRPKPEAVFREAEGALRTIASQWVQRYQQIENARPEQENIPPVLIVVCDNTEIAEVFYRKISGEREEEVLSLADLEDEEGDEEPAPRATKGKKRTVYGEGEIFPEYLSNTPERRFTVRIDTRLLKEAEIQDTGKSRLEAAEELRTIIDTVGKPGQPGEHIRCVVSVAMLNEGWDASNVTHVLGVRAFDSQLLCEQVIGRGLRRMNYDPDPETGKLPPEHVDVYGIPFSIIPFKGKPTSAPEDTKPRNHVYALSARKPLEIRIPIVEAYVYALRDEGITCDIDTLERLEIHPSIEPTTVWIADAKGYVDKPALSRPDSFVQQTRETYYATTRMQTILFRVTNRVVDDLLAGIQEGQSTDRRRAAVRLAARHRLFPQVYAIVSQFVERKVTCHPGTDKRELGLERYSKLLAQRIRDNILPAASSEDSPLLPVLNPYRPHISTKDVDYMTTRPVVAVERSHLNAVDFQSGWERDAALVLERCDLVEAFVRNNRNVGLSIPYDYGEETHRYEPDFIVRLVDEDHPGDGLRVVLEIKGFEHFEPDRVNAKNAAARKWVSAINNYREYGRWDYVICRDVTRLETELGMLPSSAND
jgi:type III restriction enzyme